ncbi:hypothetical protein AKJ16_DCAP25277 [Drosera capensis]
MPNPALAAGSSRLLSWEPVATSCTNLLPGEPPVQDGVLPDPVAYQASSCSPHDLLARQHYADASQPTKGDFRNECIDLCDAYGYSRGGYRSMFGQDAVFPETAGLSPYPGMQAQGGRGQPGQMPFGWHFEVGESSKSRPKRKRQDEWMPPPQRARLDRSQGILGGHGLSTRQGVFFSVDLYSSYASSPSLTVETRDYSGFTVSCIRCSIPGDELACRSPSSGLHVLHWKSERQSTNDILSLGLLIVNLGIHPYSSPAPYTACRSSFVNCSRAAAACLNIAKYSASWFCWCLR